MGVCVGGICVCVCVCVSVSFDMSTKVVEDVCAVCARPSIKMVVYVDILRFHIH